MDSFTKNIRRAVLNDPGVAAECYTKNDIYGVIIAEAEDTRKADETVERARVRVMKSADGARVMAAYQRAKSEPRVERAAASNGETILKSMPGNEIVARIHDIAAKIAREESIALPQARARAWQRNPDLKRAYDDAQAAARGR